MNRERPAGWIDPFANGGWPSSVRGCATTRDGASGFGFDLGGVSAAAVIADHRAALPAWLGVERVQFLRQVHGAEVVEIGAEEGPTVPEADAAVTRSAGVALAILAADCLPVLFADREGTCIAAAHAGWRGLVAGVLERTLEAMGLAPSEVLVWLGPAIGQDAFEVGPEVRAAILDSATGSAEPAALERALRRGRDDRWHVDLPGVAAARLRARGVGRVEHSGIDSWADAGRFFSHRRDQGNSGRQATLVWLSPRRRS
ncbi:MAG: peptidoglycan editing factor PgeF [Pseudomonadales bacterium]|jgi:YfiH family protein|nr:peptidoglycan editing factor PgeF [Pseudomonadales bacterium]